MSNPIDEAVESKNIDERACTCHPDDNPPKPCPRQFALNECRAEHNRRIISKINEITREWNDGLQDASGAMVRIETVLDEGSR